MSQLFTAVPLPSRRLSLPRPRLVLILGAILAVLAASAAAYWFTTNGSSSLSPAATGSAIEQRWGIQVKQVAVTADGGLIDFRFQVIDPDKALTMMQDVNNLPVLEDEDTHVVVNSAASMAEKHSLTQGETYFFLYRNAGGALRSGGKVTVAFKSLRLEHVDVK